MKLTHRIILGSAISLVALGCQAQNLAVPLRQIEREARDPVLSAKAAMIENPSARTASDAAYAEPLASTGFVQPAATQKTRTLSTGYYLLNGLHLGMAILDVEMTQHCIANHHCTEGNPLMPSSQAGQLGVNFALVGYGSFLSYKLKKHDSKLWILSPTVGIAAHTLGFATGIKNR
jgi:hypothetical protein